MESKHFRQLNKIVFINVGNCPYSEIELSGNTCFIGINGEGKSTTQRAILFFYNADTQKLGIPRNLPFKPFEEYYFPSYNSYIIYEVKTETGEFFHIITSRQNRIVFYFVEGPYNKEHFIQDRMALGLNEVLASIRNVLPSIYVSKRVDTFQEYREIIYGATKSKDFKDFYLIHGNSKYDNVPRAITDIFLSSSATIEADFIKNFIANAVSETGTDISLDQIKRQIRQFKDKLEDVENFKRPENQHLAQLIDKTFDQLEQYKFSQQDTAVQLGSAIKYAQNQIDVLDFELGKINDHIFQADQNFKEKEYNHQQTKDQQNILLGGIESNINKAESLERTYHQSNAPTLLSLYQQKDSTKAEWNARTIEYTTLTTAFQDTEQRFALLYQGVDNERASFEIELSKKGLEIDRLFTGKQEEIKHVYAQQLDVLNQQQTQEITELTYDAAAKKEALFKLELEVSLIKGTVPFQKELSEIERQLLNINQELYEAKLALEQNPKDIKSLIEKAGLVEEKYKSELKNYQERKQQAIAEKKEQLESLRKKLSLQHNAFYGFLETNYPDWKETIGKVCSEDLLFRTDLEPSLSSLQVSLYGIQLNLSGVEVQAKSIQEYETSQRAIEQEIKELENAVIEYRKEAGEKQEAELAPLRKKIQELNEQSGHLNYKVQSLQTTLEEKQLSHSDWISKSQGEKDRLTMQNNDKQKSIRQDLQAITNKITSLQNILKTEIQSLQSERWEKEKAIREQHNRSLEILQEEKESKLTDLAQRQLEIDQQKASALQNEGIDSKRITQVREEVRKLKAILDQLEQNEELVIKYKNDKEEYIDKIEVFKKERQQLLKKQEEHTQEWEKVKKDHAGIRLGLESQQRQVEASKKEHVEGLRYYEKQFASSSHLAEVYKNKITQAPEAFVEVSIIDLCLKLQSLQQKFINDSQILRESISKLAGSFRADNHFNFKVNNTTEFDYQAFATNLKSFVVEDRLRTSIDELGRQHWMILDSIGTKVNDLMRQLDKVKKTILNIDSELESSNFSEGRLIQFIKIRYKEGKSLVLKQLQAIAEIKNAHQFGIGELNLFNSNTKQNNELHKKSVDALAKLFKILEEEGKEKIQLQDTFELQFNIKEKKNETGWVERLPKIGSDGTDILVKSIIYIILLNLFIKESTQKTAQHFKVHCLIDEVGKIATNYMKELLKFVAPKNILLINGLPNESKLEMHYNTTYKLRNGKNDTMQIIKLLTNTIEV
ncbi:ATP-binding protein [Flavisolibacter tropicus]|uniref:ATP-binding protein n=1 Tax=Flavisolibacter tropicus TaxID=1492898 RepID=A0A172TV67_9BACT|nr:ATP-binding protein [Flavisolibacter tropicus]ANE50627.1 hypothetical protein SY85_09060 [Flavisolibacter tropicus]